MATGINLNLAGIVKFGVYEVDARIGELRRNGVRIKLQEQPFQLLAVLLEKPGEVVTREELRHRLWPADTFVDFDHSLNAAVKRLRDALHDSADNPRFVETVARRGYRFVAPVSGELPANLATPRHSRFRLRARWVAAAAILLAGACLSAGFHIGNHVARAYAPREVRLTANSPDVPVYRASMSPDGRLLAFTDPRGLFLREVDREDSHQVLLPPDFRAHSVAWFPDGSHLLVGGVDGNQEKSATWKLSILGGEARQISGLTEGGALSPDGGKIAFLTGDEKFNHSELWMMNADGSQARKLYDIPGYSSGVAWSPNAKRIAYCKATYWPGNSAQVHIESYELATGKVNEMFADSRLYGSLSWSRGGRLFFTRDDSANTSVSDVWSVRVDEQTGELRGDLKQHTSGPDWKPRPEVSPDGKQLTFLRSNIAPSVYVADVNPKTKALEKVRRLTLDESRSRPYEWTPDGKSVLYVSDRDGQFHIFRQGIGDASPELLVDGKETPSILRLNPDATEIIYDSDAHVDGHGHGGAPSGPGSPNFELQKVRLMRAPIKGGVGQLLLEAEGINNFQCARAPSRVCLYSRFEKNALDLVQFDSVTGESKLFYRADEPRWQDYNWTLSPEGKLLAMCKQGNVSDNTSIRLIPLDGEPPREIHLKEWVAIVAFDWAADGRSFWASAMLRGDQRALLSIDLRGNLTPVLNDGKPYMGWAIPSRDGKHLALWESTGNSNVWMLDGL